MSQDQQVYEFTCKPCLVLLA